MVLIPSTPKPEHYHIDARCWSERLQHSLSRKLTQNHSETASKRNVTLRRLIMHIWVSHTQSLYNQKRISQPGIYLSIHVGTKNQGHLMQNCRIQIVEYKGVSAESIWAFWKKIGYVLTILYSERFLQNGTPFTAISNRFVQTNSKGHKNWIFVKFLKYQLCIDHIFYWTIHNTWCLYRFAVKRIQCSKFIDFICRFYSSQCKH